MAEDFDHAEWERWCESWEGVDFGVYPHFREWQNAGTDAKQSEALERVIDQAEAADDIKMIRKVYYHAPYGSSAKKRSLRLTLAHGLKTKDVLLVRDVWQHAGSEREVQTEANKAYEQLTGSPYSN